MKIDEIAFWEAFQGVALYGGFSQASRALRVGVTQLSKRVARLEERLGVRLFQRSTRVVTLTDEGKQLLPRVRSILEDLSGIESSFENKHELSGTIRLTSVPFVAHRLLIPVLSEFMKKYPGVQFEVELSEGFVNLLESGFDMAIRIHDEPEDSSLIYRKLASNDLVVCASPGYLKKHLKNNLKNHQHPLKKPADLRRHELLMLDLHRNCRFRHGSHRLAEFTESRKISCENGWFLTELALRDLGVLVRSYWDVREHLKTGALVQVLKENPLEAFGNIFAVIPSRRLLAPRVRAFLDFVVQKASQWKCV